VYVDVFFIVCKLGNYLLKEEIRIYMVQISKKMVVNGPKHKNVPSEYLKALKQSKKCSKDSQTLEPKPYIRSRLVIPLQ